MDNQFAIAQNYQSGKILIQTFGRGNLPRYIEPNMSERNNFERSCIEKQKQSQNKFNQRNQQNTAISKQKNITDKQNLHITTNQNRTKGKTAPFEQIDQISSKINGIIRSISNSYNKKKTYSQPKPAKLNRCETVQKLQHLQHKYNNHHNSESKLKAKQGKSNQQVLEQGIKTDENAKSWDSKSTNSKAKTENIHKQSVKIFDNPCLQEQTLKREDEDYDDINKRIQYISDKITRYERKMANYQQFYNTNKKITEQYLKENNQPKNKQQIEKNQLIESKQSDKTSSSQKQVSETTQQTNAQISVNAGYSNFNQIYSFKKNNIPRKQSGGFFQEKYKQINQNNYKYQKPHHSKEDYKKIVQRTKLVKQDALKQSNKHYEEANIGPAQKPQLNTANKTSFIKAIVKQIALDQDFRHAKHMFGGMDELFDNNYHKDSQKWFKLQLQLSTQGFSFSIEEVKQIFMPRDDQIDPFMSVSHSHQELIYGVIFAYQAAEKHWKEQIHHGWSFWELKESNFTSDKLDQGKKGFVSLQDLTFYINTQIDCSFRNRDIMLIYNRLSSRNSQGDEKHRIKYKQILDQLLTA